MNRNIEFKRNSKKCDLLKLLRQRKIDLKIKPIDKNSIIDKFIRKMKKINVNFKETDFIITKEIFKDPSVLINNLPLNLKRYFILELIKENTKPPQCFMDKVFNNKTCISNHMLRVRDELCNNRNNNWELKVDLNNIQIHYEIFGDEETLTNRIKEFIKINNINSIEDAIDLKNNHFVCLVNSKQKLKVSDILKVENGSCVAKRKIPALSVICVVPGFLASEIEIDEYMRSTFCESYFLEQSYFVNQELLCNIENTSNETNWKIENESDLKVWEEKEYKDDIEIRALLSSVIITSDIFHHKNDFLNIENYFNSIDLKEFSEKNNDGRINVFCCLFDIQNIKLPIMVTLDDIPSGDILYRESSTERINYYEILASNIEIFEAKRQELLVQLLNSMEI